MTLLTILARPLVRLNDILLAIGRWAGVFAVAAMVIAILIQIWFRYVLNSALPWPDEAARFCMLWMAGLMAPSAFRSGGFVAIDMIAVMLPKLLGRSLTLVLLVFSLLVSVAALKLGWAGITGFGGKFATASLWVPENLAFDAWIRVPRSWMMASLVVGFALLVLVNIELILRNLLAFRTGDDPLPPVWSVAGGAE